MTRKNLSGLIGLVSAAFVGMPTLPHGWSDTPANTTSPNEAPLDPATVQNFGNKDVNRLQGNIAKALARANPYLDVLDGGTIAANVSDVQRTVIQERAVLNASLVRPAFVDDISAAGTTGESAEVGTTTYNFKLQTLRGMGPLVTIQGARNTFEGSYTAAEDALKKQIVNLNNADVRITMTDFSGCKLVCNSTVAFDQMFNGDMQAISTSWTTEAIGAPDSPLNFKVLEYLGIFVRENLLVEGFEGNQSEPLLKLIASQEIINALRNEEGVITDHRYLTTGQYKIGETALTRYRWEGPYRGWAFGVDPQPLRFSYLDGNGDPLFIEPEIRVETSGTGVGSRPNPQWVRARYEVALAVGANSFFRLAPAQYTGEGSFKFPAQLSMGALKWQVILDNSQNVWGDYGRHFFQIRRAFKPQRPHAITAIAYKRNVIDFGLTPVADASDYSSAAAL